LSDNGNILVQEILASANRFEFDGLLRVKRHWTINKSRHPNVSDICQYRQRHVTESMLALQDRNVIEAKEDYIE